MREMPVPLRPEAIVTALSDRGFHENIRKLSLAGQLPNERTLQAYVWNYLLEKTVEAYHDNNVRVYHDDWAIFIELYEGKKRTYPDISFLRKTALNDPEQTLFIIELKHHSSVYTLHENDITQLLQDVTKVNNANCEGVVLFTCPLEELYIDVLRGLNDDAEEGTSVIVIQCT